MDADKITTVQTQKKIDPKHLNKFARKLAFAKFVQNHLVEADTKLTTSQAQWKCCHITFTDARDFHRHVAIKHAEEIQVATGNILTNGCHDARWSALQGERASAARDPVDEQEKRLPCEFEPSDVYPWLPQIPVCSHGDEMLTEGQVLLFYKYRVIHNTRHVLHWQEELCKRLSLTGKVRVGREGVNVTVAGSIHHTETYIMAVKNHPFLSDLVDTDFKRSPGSADVFPDGLKVGIYQEIVPMGVDPQAISHENTGQHLSVDEFHRAVEQHLADQDNDAVFVDCRNFYESKIGQFKGAVCPDIRKFSYWPEYVEKNRAMFEKKKVYMYCTGGIRCERGSAYLKNKGISEEVYQLDGGIHKYIEKYPDGHFRGKLFVFDDRYQIPANDDIISNCCYCGSPWYQYQPCSSAPCHQLVLSCDECRSSGLTACCRRCQAQNAPSTQGNPQGQDIQDIQGGTVTQGVPMQQHTGYVREECDCTEHRTRIPAENL